jgi:DNA-binding NarL/FixJ family response regulator
MDAIQEIAKGGAVLSPQAAAEPGISIHAAGLHLRSVYGKLRVRTRSEAVARALRDDLMR